MVHPLYYSDLPEDRDALDFSDFRPALTEVLLLGQTPLTVGVFGPWGSGKTSLLRMLRDDITIWGERLGQPVRTVWFTAWKYERREALWRALLLRVLDALYPRTETEPNLPWEQRPRKTDAELNDKERQLVATLERLEQSLYREVTWEEVGQWTVHWWEMVKSGGRLVADLALLLFPLPEGVRRLLKAWEGQGLPEDLDALLRAVRREMHTYRMERLASIEQFEAAFRQALNLAWEAQGVPGRLILFVDDLDRCLPEKALEILEAIKLFLDVEGTAFVLALDRDVIRQGVEAYYAHYTHTARPPISGDAYLQKFVQIPFTLPPLAMHQMERMLQMLERPQSRPPATWEDVTLPVDPDARTLTPDVYRIFASGLKPNPRQVKRAVNTFRLLQAVALVREERGRLPPGTSWPLLAKIVVMQLEFSEIYEAWLQPGYEMLLPALEVRLRFETTTQGGEAFPEFLQKRLAQARLGPIPENVMQRARDLLNELRKKPGRFLRFTTFFLYEAQETGPRFRFRFTALTPGELLAYQRLVAPLHMVPLESHLYGDVATALKQRDPATLWERLLSYRGGPEEQREHLARWLPFLLKQQDMPEWVLQGARAILQAPEEELAHTLLRLAAQYPEARDAARRILRLQRLIPHVLPLLHQGEALPEAIRELIAALLAEAGLSKAQRQAILRDARAARTLFQMLAPQKAHLLPWIQDALTMPDANVRALALDALAQTEQPVLLEQVRASLQDRDPEVRLRAARLLGQWKDQESLEGLVRLLRDRDYRVQQAAVQALRRFGPTVMPVLARHLDTSIPSFRERIMEVVATLDDEKTRQELRRWLQDPRPRVREAGAWLLGYLGQKEDLLNLARALNDENPNVQKSAREALIRVYKRLGSHALDEFLAHLLGLHAEARLPYLRALYLLREHLRQDDIPLVRRALERILDSTSSLESQEHIRRLLRELV